MSVNNPTDVGQSRQPDAPTVTPSIPPEADGCQYKHINTRPEGFDKNEHTVIVWADGTYKKEEDNVGFGYTIHTQRGTKIVEGAGYAPNATTSMHAESVAVLTAIQVAKKFEPKHLVIYTDCQNLTDQVTRQYLPQEKRIPRSIQVELTEIRDVSINYIPRENNKRAHYLAKKGLQEFTPDAKKDLLP